MAENYKLVSEDEWQAMVDRAEVAEGWHEHWRDVAERWKDRAELAEKSERQLAAVLDQKADREEPVGVAGDKSYPNASICIGDGEPVEMRGREEDIDKLWRIVDGARGDESLSFSTFYGRRFPRMPEESDEDDTGPQTTVSSTSESAPNFVYAFPQRPHESLVWAIYHAAAMVANFVVNKVDLHPHHAAEKAMGTWRDRWPESE